MLLQMMRIESEKKILARVLPTQCTRSQQSFSCMPTVTARMHMCRLFYSSVLQQVETVSFELERAKERKRRYQCPFQGATFDTALTASVSLCL